MLAFGFNSLDESLQHHFEQRDQHNGRDCQACDARAIIEVCLNHRSVLDDGALPGMNLNIHTHLFIRFPVKTIIAMNTSLMCGVELHV